jgi:phage/plasmid-like protein (TIGR03299 family)
MAYYRDKPWHGLGTKIAKRATTADMIAASGLDWTVVARGARGAKKNKKGHFSRYEVIRMPRPDMLLEEEILLAVTSKSYVPLQNQEAFSFFDPVIAENKAVFDTAGALGHGECVWVLAKMPGEIEIVRGDDCMRYLLLSNRHDGKGSVTVKFTAVRVVCQNTLMLALKDGESAYRVRHSKSMARRLADIGEILGMARKMYEECGNVYKRMAKTALVKSRLDAFLQAVYPMTEAQRKSRKRPEKWERIDRRLQESKDLLLPGVKGSLWAAYNAVTGFEDYRQMSTPEEAGARLNRVWFGSGADAKFRALEAGRRLASA